MVIWAFVRVPSSQGLFKHHTSLEGAALSWAWLRALNSALGLYSTLAVNIPDFTVSARSFCLYEVVIKFSLIELCSGMQRMSEREFLYIVVQESWYLMPICARQTIHTDIHYTHCIHFCWFHWHRCHVCGYQPLRRSSLGPIAVGASLCIVGLTLNTTESRKLNRQMG
jgi:hypothetical protein